MFTCLDMLVTSHCKMQILTESPLSGWHKHTLPYKHAVRNFLMKRRWPALQRIKDAFLFVDSSPLTIFSLLRQQVRPVLSLPETLQFFKIMAIRVCTMVSRLWTSTSAKGLRGVRRYLII